jgi:hypothetical protein
VVLIYDQDGLHLKEVFIGVEENIPPLEKIFLDLDDSSLGIGLNDQVKDIFGDQNVCQAWVIGHWGSLVEIDIPGLEFETDEHPFTVRKIVAREDGPKRNMDAHIWVK